MRIILILTFVGAVAFLGGCADDSGVNGTPPVTDAQYIVTFAATWSAETHPINFPGNPHFSRLVGVTHNSSVAFWSTGVLATLGIKNVAEVGSGSALLSEVATAVTGQTAEHSLLGDGIGMSPGETSLSFSVTADYPQVTLVSMLAPSPDWFVGVSGLNLLSAGAWVDSLTVELFLYDAGTDNGGNYTSVNQPADPPVAITRIEGFPALVDGEIRPFGTFTFTRQ